MPECAPSSSVPPAHDYGTSGASHKPSIPAGLPGYPQQAFQQNHLGFHRPDLGFGVPANPGISLLTRFAPPPIFLHPTEEARGAVTPAVRSLLAEWEPWMLKCSSY